MVFYTNKTPYTCACHASKTPLYDILTTWPEVGKCCFVMYRWARAEGRTYTITHKKLDVKTGTLGVRTLNFVCPHVYARILKQNQKDEGQ